MRELVVAMNGDEVARLIRRSQGTLELRYAPGWLDDEAAVPLSLSLPLSPEPYSGDRVWSYFDNLLPDSVDIRSRMQRSLGAESRGPFDLLAAAGRDCVGALQLFDPSQTGSLDVRRIDAIPVTDAWIAERLRSHRTHPLGLSLDEDFRISIAGVQEKTALLLREGAWHQPRGATPTTHILKLPIGAPPSGIDLGDSVENEWLCLQVAAAFGLPVPRSQVRDFDGVRVLVVERLDRRPSRDGSWLIRLPQEDLCQALGLPSTKKYESEGGPGIADVLEILLQSTEPAADRRTFFRALVVYWLLAAIDGHAKNFSLFLHAAGRCRMTPLYDILSAHPVVARKQLAPHDLKMAMAVDGANRHYRWRDIQRRHWISTARKARFSPSEARAVLDECSALVPSVLETVSSALPSDFPSAIAQPIFDGIEAAAARL